MSTADPLAVVQQYIGGFNADDAQAMSDMFVVSGSILDAGGPIDAWVWTKGG